MVTLRTSRMALCSSSIGMPTVPRGPYRAVLGQVHLLVAAGAEGLFAGPAEDDGVDGLLLVRALEGVDQLLDRLQAESIEHFGAVDGDADRIGATS